MQCASVCTHLHPYASITHPYTTFGTLPQEANDKSSNRTIFKITLGFVKPIRSGSSPITNHNIQKQSKNKQSRVLGGDRTGRAARTVVRVGRGPRIVTTGPPPKGPGGGAVRRALAAAWDWGAGREYIYIYIHLYVRKYTQRNIYIYIFSHSCTANYMSL